MKILVSQEQFSNLVKEAVDPKTVADFIKYAENKLGLKDGVKIKLQKGKKGIRTTGVYKDDEKDEINVYIGDRLEADILRTLAHELVHHKQHQKKKTKKKDLDKSEGEANAEAGKILRMYGKKHPEIYKT